jgi:hypothetical protein
MRVLAGHIEFVSVVRMLDGAYGNSTLTEFLDKVNDQARLAVVFSADNMQSIHDAFQIETPARSLVVTVRPVQGMWRYA